MLPKPRSSGKHGGVASLTQVPFFQKLEKPSGGQDTVEKVTMYNFATKMNVTKHTIKIKLSNITYYLRFYCHMPLLRNLHYPFYSVPLPFSLQRKCYPLATQVPE